MGRVWAPLLSMCPLLAPRSQVERAVRRMLKWLPGLLQQPQCAPLAPQPKPTLQLTHFISCNGTGSRAAYNQGENLAMGCRGSPVPGWSQVGRAAVVGMYASSASEAATTLMMAVLPRGHTKICTEDPCGPCLACTETPQQLFGPWKWTNF